MLIYLYGLPGTGKNFIGTIFQNNFNFVFQDADDYLPINMKNKLNCVLIIHFIYKLY